MIDEEKINELFTPDFETDPMKLFEKITPRPPKTQDISQDTDRTPYQRYQDLSKEERHRKYAERLGFEQELRKQSIIDQLKNKFHGGK